MSGEVQFKLRLPAELHDKIKHAAAVANRSMGEEIVARLSRDGTANMRDQFAAAALPSVMELWRSQKAEPFSSWQRMCARISYAHADAMLEAREATP